MQSYISDLIMICLMNLMYIMNPNMTCYLNLCFQFKVVIGSVVFHKIEFGYYVNRFDYQCQSEYYNLSCQPSSQSYSLIHFDSN